jgi:hypothetical protein
MIKRRFECNQGFENRLKMKFLREITKIFVFDAILNFAAIFSKTKIPKKNFLDTTPNYQQICNS